MVPAATKVVGELQRTARYEALARAPAQGTAAADEPSAATNSAPSSPADTTCGGINHNPQKLVIFQVLISGQSV